MQIATKYITDNAVTDVKIRLTNAGFLRGRNAANSADINMWAVSSSNNIQAGATVDFNSQSLINAPNPVNPNDVSNKAYVDSVAAGLSPKEAVVLASAAALPANTYANGSSGVGATLTANANGALTVDGVATSVGMRILVKNEAAQANNGIYVVTDAGSGGTPYILTRSTDLDLSAQFGGANVFVVEGTANTGTEWVCLTYLPTIGTTSISFTQFGSSAVYTAGNGITISSFVVSVNNGVGLTFSGSQLIAQTQGPGTANTTGIDGSNNIKALKAQKSTFTLSSGDITNQYVDLSVVAHTSSITLQPVGGMSQQEGQDYSVSYTGGSGGNTRITFLNGLATGGASALVAGDVLLVQFQTL